MAFAITAPYAAVLTVLMIILTQHVIRERGKASVGLGDGGSIPVLQAMRRQANFVENVPLALILMILAEAGGSGAMTLNILGLILVAARLIHPFGIKSAAPAHPARIIGAVATNGVQLALVVILLMQHFA